MSDVHTVMDAAAVERAVVMGANEGSMMASLFAATYPERVSSSSPMRRLDRPGRRITRGASPPETVEAIVETVDRSWGDGLTFAAVNPTIAGDDQAVQAWGRFLEDWPQAPLLRPP